MSVTPLKHHFTIWRGGTWRYRFEWQLKVGSLVEPQDLTGYTGIMTIVPVGSTIPWMIIGEKESESDSGIAFHEETGIVDILISEEDTETIPWKQAKFELKVKNGVGEAIPLIVGQLTALGPL